MGFMDIIAFIKDEVQLIIKSTVGVKWKKISGQQIKRELISNAVSMIIAVFVASLLSNFFVAKSAKNLWGLGSQKVKVSKDSMELMETVIIFVVGLIVFTMVEQVMDNYFHLKDEREKESSNL